MRFRQGEYSELICRPVMKISIANLSEGVHAYHFSAEPEHLALGENFTKQVSVDVALDKASREIFLKVKATTSGRFVCDRCVGEFNRDLVAAYRMAYMYDEREKENYGDDEVHFIREGTTVIDISEDIRQFLLLSVPLKLLCSDQCRGLCPRCGQNWNHGTCSCKTEETDSRWEKLEKHFKN